MLCPLIRWNGLHSFHRSHYSLMRVRLLYLRRYFLTYCLLVDDLLGHVNSGPADIYFQEKEKKGKKSENPCHYCVVCERNGKKKLSIIHCV